MNSIRNRVDEPRCTASRGHQQNRIRFLVDVAEAVAAEVGSERTGIRLSPFITQRNMADDEIIPTMLLAAKELNRIGVAYIHLSEADWDDAPAIPEAFRHDLRATYDGAIIVAGKYDQERATAILASGLADLVAFGRAFIANPDLPQRFYERLPLTMFDSTTLFGGNARGLTDYPPYRRGTMEEVR
jgi:N-ethylmaleimide reductase